jgi:hypothetical protein
MSELIRLDGVDVAMTPDTIKALFAECKKQYEELRGRLDAMGLELEKEKSAQAYEKWVEHSSKLLTIPLSGSLR